jgi:hypothetical protein
MEESGYEWRIRGSKKQAVVRSRAWSGAREVCETWPWLALEKVSTACTRHLNGSQGVLQVGMGDDTAG